MNGSYISCIVNKIAWTVPLFLVLFKKIEFLFREYQAIPTIIMRKDILMEITDILANIDPRMTTQNQPMIQTTTNIIPQCILQEEISTSKIPPNIDLTENTQYQHLIQKTSTTIHHWIMKEDTTIIKISKMDITEIRVKITGYKNLAGLFNIWRLSSYSVCVSFWWWEQLLWAFTFPLLLRKVCFFFQIID